MSVVTKIYQSKEFYKYFLHWTCFKSSRFKDMFVAHGNELKLLVPQDCVVLKEI